MENPDAIEIAEGELGRLIDVMHQSGLNYWTILKIFLEVIPTIAMRSEVEYYLNIRK